MLTHVPGRSVVHRLDPRTKLAVQVGVAAAAFAHPTPGVLAGLGLLAVAAVFAADLRVRSTLWVLRVPLAVIVAAPLVAAAFAWPDRLGTVRGPLLASGRALVLVVLAVVYARTTAPRDSRAAVAWLVPGRPGRALGLGVGLVFRTLPLVLADLRRARTAALARCGDRRPVHRRVALVATAGLGRALDRADRLAVALRARCLAWNPTSPDLRFGRVDAGPLALAVTLVGVALV